VSRLALAACGLLLACGPARVEAPAPQHAAFWERVQALCGQTFEGRVVEAPEGDATFTGHRLVMHVRDCDEDEIRIPLQVGDDRSRTWVLSRTPDGLRLRHDHRRPDGTPDDNTDYGGHTAAPGTAARQEFPADAFSIAAVPARATQYWYLELHPGPVFAYGLHRQATGLRYRFEFAIKDDG
jgi:hypothetical protein